MYDCDMKLHEPAIVEGGIFEPSDSEIEFKLSKTL